MISNYSNELVVKILNYSDDPRNALVCKQWKRCQETVNDYSINAFKKFLLENTHTIEIATIIDSADPNSRKLSRLMYFFKATCNLERAYTGGISIETFRRCNDFRVQYFIDDAWIKYAKKLDPFCMINVKKAFNNKYYLDFRAHSKPQYFVHYLNVTHKVAIFFQSISNSLEENVNCPLLIKLKNLNHEELFTLIGDPISPAALRDLSFLEQRLKDFPDPKSKDL